MTTAHIPALGPAVRIKAPAHRSLQRPTALPVVRTERRSGMAPAAAPDLAPGARLRPATRRPRAAR